jgi:non-canonical purine NTP pyrophosphatase (RdgB/HAM1 family)
MKLTFITSNATKAAQLGWYLKYPVAHQKLVIPEIQSLDLREVVTHKAKAAYEQIKSPVLVEDFSLVLNTLGKLPGPFIKWFWDEIGPAGVCRMLNDFSDRSAVATVAFGLYDGHDLQIFEGQAKGMIAKSPRGEALFGSDSIFIPDGYTKTWSEMPPEERDATSIRRVALKRLEGHLAHNKVKTR